MPALAAMPAWQPYPDAWLLVVALAGGYAYALSAWGPRLAPGQPASSPSQRWCFVTGVAALWLGADWPIHTLGEGYLYSVHMIQHLLFQLVAAPLLILGAPAWLLRRLLRPRPVFVLVKAVTRPLPALVIVSAFTAFMHWPSVVDVIVVNAVAHLAYHAALLVVAFVLWWPVLSPLPELPHLSYPGRMAYLFGHSIMPTVPASFLTFASEPLYTAYAQAPQLVWWLDPVQDQQVAGLIMKIVGGLILWGVIAVLFFRWQAEESSGGPDVLYWRDLAREIEPTDAP